LDRNKINSIVKQYKNNKITEEKAIEKVYSLYASDFEESARPKIDNCRYLHPVYQKEMCKQMTNGFHFERSMSETDLWFDTKYYSGNGINVFIPPRSTGDYMVGGGYNYWFSDDEYLEDDDCFNDIYNSFREDLCMAGSIENLTAEQNHPFKLYLLLTDLYTNYTFSIEECAEWLSEIMSTYISPQDFYYIMSGYHFEVDQHDAKKYVRRGKQSGAYGMTQRHGKIGYREDLGETYRSTWEANFARILRFKNIDYKYEVKRFEFKNEQKSYLPDFYLPIYNQYIEVKGFMSDEAKQRIELFRKYDNGKLFVVGNKEYHKLAKRFSTRVDNWEGKLEGKRYIKNRQNIRQNEDEQNINGDS